MRHIPDERAVKQFTAAPCDPALHDCVHARRPHGAAHGPDPGAGQDAPRPGRIEDAVPRPANSPIVRRYPHLIAPGHPQHKPSDREMPTRAAQPRGPRPRRPPSLDQTPTRPTIIAEPTRGPQPRPPDDLHGHHYRQPQAESGSRTESCRPWTRPPDALAVAAHPGSGRSPRTCSAGPTGVSARPTPAVSAGGPHVISLPTGTPSTKASNRMSIQPAESTS